MTTSEDDSRNSDSTLRRRASNAADWGGRQLRKPWVRNTLIALASVYVAYVALIFAFLNWGGLSALSDHLDDARFQADSGYSLWPGHLNVSGADVVYQGHTLTLNVLAEEAKLEFDLLSAARGDVHIVSLEARGARYRMRHRVKSNLEGHRRRLDAFPTIEGFERSPLADKRAQRTKKPLRVHIENIDATLTEVWIMEYRTEGNFTARGGFSLTDEVKVHRSVVDLTGAHTRVGDTEVIVADECEIEAELGPFPRRNTTLDDIVGSISSNIDCTTRTDDLSFVQIYPRKKPFELEGKAVLDAKLRLDDGKIQDGNIEVRDAQTPWIWRGVRLPVTWKARAVVERPGHLRAKGSVSIDEGEYGASVKHADVKLEAKHENFYQNTLEKLEIEIEKLAVDDGRFFGAFTGDPNAPSLRIHPSTIRLKYAPRAGEFDLEGQLAATLKAEEEYLGVQASVEVDCQTEAETTRCASLHLDAAEFTLAKKDAKETIAVQIDATEFSAKLPEQFDARFDVTAENPSEFLEHALGLDFLQRMGLDLMPLGKVTAVLNLNKDRGTLAGNVPHLVSGGVEVEGRFVSAKAMTSAWLIKTPAGSYGIRQTPQKTQFHPLVGEEWFSSCEATLGTNC